MPKLDSQDLFIAQYNTALQAGLTLYQFADFLQIQPASVVRRRNRIRQEFGLELEILPLDNGSRQLVMPPVDTTHSEYKKYNIIERTDNRKVLVITSAQNATPVFKPFLNSILTYCNINDAQLMVIPYRYRNPTSMWNANNEGDEWWDKNIAQYLVTEYTQICNGLRVMGHIRIQPTASNPLSSFDSYTGTDSAIFGHPKVQLTTVPTPSKSLPKILTTTGSVTKENYTDSKSGHQGYFHHCYSATIVEIDEENDIFHIRHIQADEDGTFYDLDKKYSATKAVTSTIAGLVTGDSHVEFIDKLVVEATYTAKDSMVNVMQPPVVVMHDLEDFYPRNHHHRGNPLLAYGKQHFGRNNVEQSLQLTANFLMDCMDPQIERVVVKSNHDEAFDRWIKESDPRLDPENARFYHYMMYNMMAQVKPTATGYSWPDPFVFWCFNPDTQKGLKDSEADIRFLSRDESYSICGIEVGFHGDKGPNGARGSAKSFAKIGPKTVIGHSHTPKIEEGVYQVGLSARMDLEYVSGPSSWMQTHCIIYPNGKRTLINVVNGIWRLKKGT
jgi:hypothetical protein